MNREYHTIILNPWNAGDPYLGEDFGFWDTIEIICPHDPPTARMSCSGWEPCGCSPMMLGELDYLDSVPTFGPCSSSGSGEHRDIDGELNKPSARCWALDWDQAISDRVFDLGLPAGTYVVRPWWDGDMIQLDLIDPLMRR